MKRTRIMIVEDDGIIASHLSQVLDRFGFEIVCLASAAEDAFERIPGAEPELVVMDIRLRGSLNGIEAGKIIFEKFGLPVVYLSAFSDTSFAETPDRIEPFCYLSKPFRNEELYAAIQLALYKKLIYRERAEWKNTQNSNE